MTISKAYGYLESEQLLERRPGRPLVVRRQTKRQVDLGRLDRLREGLRDSVNLSLRLDIAAEDAVDVFRSLLDEADRHGVREEDPS